MGEIFNSRVLPVSELIRLHAPILLCDQSIYSEQMICAVGYQELSLNLPIARSLSGLSISDIELSIDTIVRELFPETAPVYLTDYEMLFDPRYRIDILRLFIDISRRNKLIFRWCGAIDGDILTYAEPGFDDYKRITISDYDITVIK